MIFLLLCFFQFGLLSLYEISFSGHHNAYRYGNGVYDLVVLSQTEVEGITVLGSPARLKWTPNSSETFAEHVRLYLESLAYYYYHYWKIVRFSC